MIKDLQNMFLYGWNPKNCEIDSPNYYEFFLNFVCVNHIQYFASLCKILIETSDFCLFFIVNRDNIGMQLVCISLILSENKKLMRSFWKKNWNNLNWTKQETYYDICKIEVKTWYNRFLYDKIILYAIW